jgi:hypothetical protein
MYELIETHLMAYEHFIREKPDNFRIIETASLDEVFTVIFCLTE